MKLQQYLSQSKGFRYGTSCGSMSGKESNLYMQDWLWEIDTIFVINRSRFKLAESCRLYIYI